VVVVVADRVGAVAADGVVAAWEAPRPQARVAIVSAQAAVTRPLISLASHAIGWHAPDVAPRWPGSDARCVSLGCPACAQFHK
jgi:hypothetical protein